MNSTTRTTEIFRSREILVKLLTAQGYNMEEYSSFDINLVSTMYDESTLDMFSSRESDSCKVYVKYHSALVTKNIRSAIENIVDDLYVNEKKLSPRDTLIIVVDDEPNDSIITKIKNFYDTSGIFIVMHNIKRLQFNILEHTLVPRMEVLSETECAEIMRALQINDKSKLPAISRFDPHALALCVRPGQVCRIYRNSETAIKTIYYRACI